jgi:hypothetical protein
MQNYGIYEMKIVNRLESTIKCPYGHRLYSHDLDILTYLTERKFLWWKYYSIKQVLPDLRKPIFDFEKDTIEEVKLLAQRDYQQMWEIKVSYKNRT